jgi:nitronate monooxygenase
MAAAAGLPRPGGRPGEGEVIARTASGEPIIRYSSALPLEGTTGDGGALLLWAGQGVALAGQRMGQVEMSSAAIGA